MRLLGSLVGWGFFLLVAAAGARNPAGEAFLYRYFQDIPLPGGRTGRVIEMHVYFHDGKQFLAVQLDMMGSGGRILGSEIRIFERTDQMQGNLERGFHSAPQKLASPADAARVAQFLERMLVLQPGQQHIPPSVVGGEGQRSGTGGAGASSSHRPGSRPNPAGLPSAGRAVLGADRGPGARDYNRAREIERIQQELREGLSRSGFTAQRYMAEQRRLQSLAEAEQRERLGQVQDRIQSEIARANALRLEMLAMLSQSYDGSARESAPLLNLNHRRPSQIHIPPEGLDLLLSEARQARDRQQWIRFSELVSDLANPWSGLQGDSRLDDLADKQGIVSGPIVQPNPGWMEGLSPGLEQEIRERLNRIQSVVREQSYLLDIPETRWVLQTGVLAARLAASGHPDMLEVLAAVDHQFSGRGRGSSEPPDLSQPEMARRYRDRVYSRLAGDWAGLADSPEAVRVRRFGRDTIDINATLRAVVASTLKLADDYVDTHKPDSPSFNPPMLHAPDSEFRDSLLEVIARLQESQHLMPRTQAARDMAGEFVGRADELAAQGRLDEALQLRDTAIAMADIALGFVPVVGLGKDVYEFFSGTSLLTGEPLDTFSRSMTGLSILTAGALGSARGLGQLARISGNKAPDIGEALTRLGRDAEFFQLASFRLQRWTGEMANEISLRRFQRMGGRAEDFLPPWKEGSRVYHATSKESLTLYQVGPKGTEFSSWLMTENPNQLRRLMGPEATESYLRNGYVLPPSVPLDEIRTIRIPAGTPFLVGETAPTGWRAVDGSILQGGKTQFWLPYGVNDNWVTSIQPMRLDR